MRINRSLAVGGIAAAALLMSVPGVASAYQPDQTVDQGDAVAVDRPPGIEVASEQRVTLAAARAACPDEWSKTRGAETCFLELGDDLFVCDTEADGHHAAAYYHYQGRPLRERSYYGKNLCTRFRWDLEEDTLFDYNAERWEGNTLLNYGNWVENYTT